MKVLAENRRAKFDYAWDKTFLAGLILSGAEVKSSKAGHCSLNGAYVIIKNGEALLTNCHISPYKYAPVINYDPTQNRKLLLKFQEIAELSGRDKGGVLVPTKLLQTGRGWIKLEIAVAKARKKQDKREYLKAREAGREIRAEI